MERLVAEGIVERKWRAFAVSSDRYQAKQRYMRTVQG